MDSEIAQPTGPQAERDRLAAIVRAFADFGASPARADALMDEAVRRLQALTRATGAVLELIDQEDLVYAVASGTAKPHVGLRLAQATSLSGRCLAEHAALRSPDTAQDPRVDATASRALQARSMLVVPVLHGRLAVGVLKVTSTGTDAFDDLDEQVLRAMAGLLAGLLARAAAG
ncbi:MAG: GAF domain-containing protein [Lysobacter sp.]|nr:GAF domain-containing protein [Lysobacter sp.]